jgi:hypothetical protein
MNTFCPFIKGECKTGECNLYKSNKCLITAFLEHFTTPKESSYSSHVQDKEEKVKIPQELQTATVEELANELIAYAKAHYAGEERFWLDHQIKTCFWEEKEVPETYELPASLKLKIDKAERLAEKKLEEERAHKEKERLKKEKEQLPSLVDECVSWAKENNLARGLKKADTDVFVTGKDLDILPETKYQLWSMANVRLKASR